MSDEANFGIIASLQRHFHREVHSPLGVTLTQLARSDRDRLEFFDASLIVRDPLIERRYVDGEAERVVIEAAQTDPTVRACLGYISIADRRPAEFAWLLTEDGIIDPAWSQHRYLTVEGFLGVTLRDGEAMNWLPGDRHRSAVAERESARQKLPSVA